MLFFHASFSLTIDAVLRCHINRIVYGKIRKMVLKKHVKNRRKLKILLLLIILVLIAITLAAILSAKNTIPTLVNGSAPYLKNNLVGSSYIRIGNGIKSLEPEQPQAPLSVLKSPEENGIIVPEKYEEHKIKARIMQDKIAQLKRQRQRGGAPNNADTDPERTILDTVTKGVHIFYTAPVQWYKSKKSQTGTDESAHLLPAKEVINDMDNDTGDAALLSSVTTHKPMRMLNIAFYPSLGLYKPTKNLLQQHFINIKNCGVGVLILSYTGKPNETEVYKQILDLAPKHNLSVTFELSVSNNQSLEYVRQQLLYIKNNYASMPGFYQVYSQSRGELVPLIYISNAYKLNEAKFARMFCRTEADSVRHTLDAIFIGHIRLKNQAEIMRRLCFDGFYSKLPSNGATFASTWKNWSFLKTFALTYNMLFVPTVGPGFAERNKFPRHGDIQRHRSNGRYYGVAWRTAILNHVGFINIASYNNWPDGSQIEEAIPKSGYLDYNPGATTKYLDLTSHWVGNFLKSRQEASATAINGDGQSNCYELLNNTIC